MAPKMSNGDILRAMTGFAQKRRTTFTLHGSHCGYVRVSGLGYRSVSVAAETPLCRFTSGPVKTFEVACEQARGVPQPLADQRGSAREERRVQAHIIREALLRNCDLSRVLGDRLPFDELKFAFDEVRLGITRVDGRKTTIRCDILAVGVTRGSAEPVLIELKFERDLRRLTEQLDGFTRLIHQYQQEFDGLLKAATGLEVTTRRVHRVIVWPAPRAGVDAEGQRAVLREAGVCSVTYSPDGARPLAMQLDVETNVSKPSCRPERQVA